jgi:hypothetical protein
MAALSTIIAGVGLGLSAAGTAVSVIGQMQASEGAKRAEALRERQMNLEAARQRRSVVRQALRARSIALTNATDQGATGGSGIAGGLGQIANTAASNTQAINQGVQIGSDMFRANETISGGQTLASFGSGLSNLGGSMYQGSETLGRIGSYFTQRRG